MQVKFGTRFFITDHRAGERYSPERPHPVADAMVDAINTVFAQHHVDNNRAMIDPNSNGCVVVTDTYSGLARQAALEYNAVLNALRAQRGVEPLMRPVDDERESIVMDGDLGFLEYPLAFRIGLYEPGKIPPEQYDRGAESRRQFQTRPRHS